MAKESDKIGNYIINGELGKGSFGTVYLATDTVLKRHVVVKIINPSLLKNEKTFQRFKNECLAVARLSHPSVVALYDAVLDEKMPHMIMEYIKGESLGVILKKEEKIHPDLAAFILFESAKAIAHAHENNVVHRDIKPANILISADGKVKITDFGLSRLTDTESITTTGSIIGTPEYFSPEAISGNSGEKASDLWSLGIMFYKMLTGVSPFERGSIFKTINAISTESWKNPSELNPEIPDPLLKILEKLSVKDPGKRLNDAGKLADLLSEYLNDREIPVSGDILKKFLSEPSYFERKHNQSVVEALLKSALRERMSGKHAKTVMLLAEAGRRSQNSESIKARIDELLKGSFFKRMSLYLKKMGW